MGRAERGPSRQHHIAAGTVTASPGIPIATGERNREIVRIRPDATDAVVRRRYIAGEEAV